MYDRYNNGTITYVSNTQIRSTHFLHPSTTIVNSIIHRQQCCSQSVEDWIDNFWIDPKSECQKSTLTTTIILRQPYIY